MQLGFGLAFGLGAARGVQRVGIRRGPAGTDDRDELAWVPRPGSGADQPARRGVRGGHQQRRDLPGGKGGRRRRAEAGGASRGGVRARQGERGEQPQDRAEPAAPRLRRRARGWHGIGSGTVGRAAVIARFAGRGDTPGPATLSDPHDTGTNDYQVAPRLPGVRNVAHGHGNAALRRLHQLPPHAARPRLGAAHHAGARDLLGPRSRSCGRRFPTGWAICSATRTRSPPPPTCRTRSRMRWRVATT